MFYSFWYDGKWAHFLNFLMIFHFYCIGMEENSVHYFCIMQPYQIHWLDLVVFWHPLVTDYIFFFSSVDSFLLFYSLMAMARTSKTMLNSSGETGHTCFIPYFIGNAISFSPLRKMFAVDLSYMTLIIWRQIFPMPTFRSFKYIYIYLYITNESWILSKAFYASIEIIIWFLFFSLLLWYISLIDLHILKNACIPGINPTLPLCMILSLCCWILFVSILLRIFASMFIGEIFLFVISLSSFVNTVMVVL